MAFDQNVNVTFRVILLKSGKKKGTTSKHAPRLKGKHNISIIYDELDAWGKHVMHCIILSMLICQTNFYKGGLRGLNHTAWARPALSRYIWRCVSFLETRTLTGSPLKAAQHELPRGAVLPQPAAGCCCRPGPQTLRWVLTPGDQQSIVCFLRQCIMCEGWLQVN